MAFLPVHTWENIYHDAAFSTEPVAMPCDSCAEFLCESSTEWEQSALDKRLWFCCASCREKWEEENGHDYEFIFEIHQIDDENVRKFLCEWRQEPNGLDEMDRGFFHFMCDQAIFDEAVSCGKCIFILRRA